MGRLFRLEHRGASETDRMKWCGIVQCVRENWIFECISREQYDMPCQLSSGENLESENLELDFRNIEQVTQKYIKLSLTDETVSSLQENDYKYRLKHKSVHGFV